MTPKVSVIIPAYNAMLFLPETINSLRQQTFTDFEVIIVNDGSSDDIEEWVLQIDDPRVKLISQTNKGLAGARNTGIAHAKGEYLAFLDADDLWHPTKLEKQVRCLEENPEFGLVYSWVALMDEQSKLTGRILKSTAEGNVWKTLTQWNIVGCGSVAVVRYCCFQTCGKFDEDLGSHVEDWDMWLRIATCYHFQVIQEPLVYYRQHATSTSKNLEAMAKSYEMVIEKAFAAASPAQLLLKSRSYGSVNLCLGWIALQNNQKSYQMAQSYRQQALKHFPQLIFSREYLRLSFAIALMRWFGPDGYQRFISLFQRMRRRRTKASKPRLLPQKS